MVSIREHSASFERHALRELEALHGELAAEAFSRIPWIAAVRALAMKLLSHLPALGTTAAFTLFAAAAARYPGGTDWSAETVGHRWTENFLCALLQSKALNGADNAAQPLGTAALVVLCASIGLLFFLISRSTTSRAHRSTIEIAGIGTAVYSALVATPLHDLMVTIGLVAGLIAFGAVLNLLWRERRTRLFLWGIALVVIQAACAIIYYGNVLFVVLPVLQKVGMVIGVTWLLAVHYRRPRVEASQSSNPRPSCDALS